MAQNQEILGAQINLISTLIESTNAAAKKGIFLLDIPLEAKETLKSFTKDNDRFLIELRTCSDVPTLLASLPKIRTSTDASKAKLEPFGHHAIIKDTTEAAQSTLEGITNVERLLEMILKAPSTDDNAAESKEVKKKKKEKREKKDRRSKSEKKLKKTKKSENSTGSESESDESKDSKSEYPSSSQYTEAVPTPIPTSTPSEPQEQQPRQEEQPPLTPSSSQDQVSQSPPTGAVLTRTPSDTEDSPTPGKGWKVGTWGKSGERTRSPSASRRLLATRGENEGSSPRGGSFLTGSFRSSSDSIPVIQEQPHSQSFLQTATSPPKITTKGFEPQQPQPETKPAESKPAEQTPLHTTHEQPSSQPQSPQETQPAKETTREPVKLTEPESKMESPKEPTSPLENSPRTAQRRATARNADVAYRSSLMITPQQLKEAQLAFGSPIAEVNPSAEEEEVEPQSETETVKIEVVVVPSQPKPQKPALEELLLYDKNGGFDLEDWNYKLDSLNRSCSVTIHNHTTHDLQLAQEQHDNSEWLNPPPPIIPSKRKVIIGSFSRNLFGVGKANLFYTAEGIEDRLQFSWESQKNSSKVDKVVAYVNFPFKCEKELSHKRKHTELTFIITESEVRPRASTFGTGLEL